MKQDVHISYKYPTSLLMLKINTNYLSHELTSHFFHGTPFLFERTTDGYLADILWNKISLSHQGKQLTAFVTNDKTQAFKQKSEFWITCIHFSELGNFPTNKDFSNEINDNIKKHVLILCNEMSQLWKS